MVLLIVVTVIVWLFYRGFKNMSDGVRIYNHHKLYRYSDLDSNGVPFKVLEMWHNSDAEAIKFNPECDIIEQIEPYYRKVL